MIVIGKTRIIGRFDTSDVNGIFIGHFSQSVGVNRSTQRTQRNFFSIHLGSVRHKYSRNEWMNELNWSRVFIREDMTVLVTKHWLHFVGSRPSGGLRSGSWLFSLQRRTRHPFRDRPRGASCPAPSSWPADTWFSWKVNFTSTLRAESKLHQMKRTLCSSESV